MAGRQDDDNNRAADDRDSDHTGVPIPRQMTEPGKAEEFREQLEKQASPQHRVPTTGQAFDVVWTSIRRRRTTRRACRSGPIER